MGKVCAFFGHRDIGTDISKSLEQAVRAAIAEGVTTFWVGGYGAFDSYAAGCVRRLKKEYPQISLHLILAYLPTGKDPISDNYDSTIYPEGLELVPQRFAISKRNRWIVDNCDMVIAYMLATLIKCPVCGTPMYGNVARKKKKGTEDEYTPYYYYACKHRLKVDGKPCTFRKNINEKNIDEPVIAILAQLAGDKRLAELVAGKLGDVVDEQETVKAIETTEREIRIRESSLKRLSNELDRIDPDAPYAERRIKDTSARIDELYEELAGFETDLADFKEKLEAIRQKKLTVEKVYTVLQHFGTLIDVISDEDRQMLMRTLIDEIQIFEDKQADGRIIKSVKLSIPVVYDNDISARIGLDKYNHDESVVTLCREMLTDRSTF